MMTVLGCEALGHNVWLVLLAALVCVLGCWAVTGLFERAKFTSGMQRLGWLFLTAITAGPTIWCTHFVAMLAYRPDAPVTFDPILTIVSSIIPAVGAGLGFVAATTFKARWAPAFGGAIVGLAIAAMHYCGMLAYRVDGIVSWNAPLLALSIGVAITVAAAAVHVAVWQVTLRDRALATLLLALAIVGLHFTGMLAFRVQPLLVGGGYSNPQALAVLALAIAGMSLLIIGTGVVSYVIDGDTRAQSYAQLRNMALHDSLTGLPNRAALQDHLRRELDFAGKTGGSVALIAIDLNGFKQVNDQYGHSTGDAVLEAFARRLAAEIRPDEFFARLGGDEFAIVSPRGQATRLDGLPGRIADALDRPFEIGECECLIGASIGVALFPTDAQSYETLLNNADLAMYRAKSERVGKVCYYEKSMDEQVRARRKLTSDLRAAISRGELEVFFQPQAAVSDRTTKGFEALARWNHPQLGYVPPCEFIAIAEENGLIEPLGEWVLRAACRQAATWDPPRRVAVNVSPIQLARGDLSQLVSDVLETTGLPAAMLELELTESAVVADPRRSLKMLRKIKALGVSLALDDFGSGHSSLSTLRKFPFDKIKLDRSFLWEIETSKEARAVLKAVLALGRGLAIPVLAEGIETPGQFEMLREESCDQAQGYLLGRPAPMDQLVAEGRLRVKTRSGPPPRAEAA